MKCNLVKGALTVLLSIAGSWPACGQKQEKPDERRLGDELVQNGDFASGLEGWRIGRQIEGKAALDTDAERGHVLKLENHELGVSGLITLPVKARAGQTLYFGAWVKSEGVQIVDTNRDRRIPAAASIYIEAYGRSNADQSGHLRGVYPKGVAGRDGKWQYVSGTMRVPEGAKSVQVGLYLGGRDRVGTAWFDQISVRVLEAPLLESTLRYPNYRGLVARDSSRPWVLDVSGRIYSEWPFAKLRSVVRDTQGERLHAEAVDLNRGAYAVSFESVTPETLVPGTYVWDVELLSADGETRAAASHRIHLVERMPKVYVDQEGFTVVGGERIFPLGIYTGRKLELYNGPAALRLMGEAGFNTVLSYTYGSRVSLDDARQFLDNAEAAGLRVVYSLADMYRGKSSYPRSGVTGLQDAARYVEGLRNHTALLAWNINDELGPERMRELDQMYRSITEKDAEHPVYQVLVPHQVSPEYLDTLDAWGSDPYPIGHQALDLVSRATGDIAHISGGRKSVWQVLQAFGWKNYLPKRNPNGYHPTLEEKRNMTWQALINGTRGLFYYAYYDLHLTPGDDRWQPPASPAAFGSRWADVRELLAEIRPLLPVILHNRILELDRLAPSVVQYRAWQASDGRMMIGLANVAEVAATLELAIPAGWRLPSQSQLPNGLRADLRGGKLALTLNGKGSGAVFLIQSLTPSK